MKPYTEMTKAELLEAIAALEQKLAARNGAPKVYELSKTVHDDLVRFIKGRRMEVWTVASKMTTAFTADDVLTSLKATDGFEITTKDGGHGAIRLALNWLVQTGFLTVKAEETETVEAEPKPAEKKHRKAA